MKITIGDSLYVQKKDILFLISVGEKIPKSVFDDSVNFKRGNDFVKIDGEEEIKFFKELDFIVDYNTYKDITLEEYRKIDEDITIKTESIEREFEGMSELEALDNLYLIDETEKLEYKRNALIDIISLRVGCVDSILPNDVDYFDIYNKRKRRVRKFKK